MFLRHILPSVLLTVLAQPATALEWKTETLTLSTAPFQKTQEVAFAFRNAGTKPVAILDLQTNCDCLDASADAKAYAPGANGTITARFTIGDRSGLYERLITVVTDESPVAERLLVRIEVPEITNVTPRSVSWKINEAAGEKTVDFAPAAGLTINFTDAQATNDAFTTRLETVAPGKLYRLHLVPRSTALSASAAIRVFGRDTTGHDVVVSAYASIQ